MNITRKIDHIVYTVSDLDEAIEDFEKKLGVRPVFGGFHSTQGTQNALVNLDDGCYFEILAPYDMGGSIPKPRWMGVDVLTKSQVTRWALKSDDLQKDSALLKEINPEMGELSGGSRNTASGSLLKWEMILPLSTPEVEVLPFMVDWSHSKTQPTLELPDMGCKLLNIYATHPEPENYTSIFNSLGFEFEIRKAEIISVKSILKCPKGIVEI